MDRPIRVAVVGWWHVHAADYARDTVRHPETELVAVWDDESDRGAAGAAAFGVPFEPDLDRLLARDDVDAVTITTATRDHRDVMVRAARAGKHAFTEKVLAPTVAEAQEIVAATDRAGVRLVVSLPRLAAGSTGAIARLIDSGRLGRISHARVRLSHDGALPRDGGPGWLPERFFDPETAIGGALTDLGCHPVYLVQRFLGLQPETISATYRSLTGRAVDDHAVVTAGYADGAIGLIEAGFVSAEPFVVEVHGTAGRVRYSDDDGLRASGAAFGDANVALEVPPDDPSPFAQWVEHIRAGTRADDNLVRAVELTRLVATANRAAADGRTLPYPRS